jgi:hypothetical protein
MKKKQILGPDVRFSDSFLLTLHNYLSTRKENGIYSETNSRVRAGARRGRRECHRQLVCKD